MKTLNEIIRLLNASPSPFHVVKNLEDKLVEAGYSELKEKKPFKLEKGGKYFVTRNHSSLLAFTLPKQDETAPFKVVATHTDSPTFKLKPNPIIKKGDTLQLNVEPYGGMIMSTWLDRPLGIAGRVFVKKKGKTEEKLVQIDKNLLQIPSVCIHFNRDVNDGYKWNPAVDLIPLLGQSEEEIYFEDLLKKECGIDGEILSHDLFLANRDKAEKVGLHQEFLSSPKLDDLGCVYSTFLGFLDSVNEKDINVFVAFDNEEVGSLTKQGADSTFLKDVLHRINLALGGNEETFIERVADGFLISADNAHANHPNHPELSDQTTHVEMNKGIVIKFNAQQKYTSDAESVAILKELAAKAKVGVQEFTNRSDLKGGSTLGNLSNAQVSFRSVDIGLPQLAMHSCNELCGVEDFEAMRKLIACFYSE